MEVDEVGPGSTGMMEKRLKIFEQFDFQKIVYVKKKTTSTVSAVTAKSTSFTVRERKPLIGEDLEAAITHIDLRARSLVEDATEIHSSEVKDPTLAAFIQTFGQVGRDARMRDFTEIEDVLLAQSRADMHGQLSPAEFFRV